MALYNNATNVFLSENAQFACVRNETSDRSRG